MLDALSFSVDAADEDVFAFAFDLTYSSRFRSASLVSASSARFSTFSSLEKSLDWTASASARRFLYMRTSCLSCSSTSRPLVRRDCCSSGVSSWMAPPHICRESSSVRRRLFAPPTGAATSCTSSSSSSTLICAREEEAMAQDGRIRKDAEESGRQNRFFLLSSFRKVI